MGNETFSQQPQQQNFQESIYKVTQRTHNNLYQLQVIYRLFSTQPMRYIQKMKIIQKQTNCCTMTSLQIITYKTQLSLDNLLVKKRIIKKDFAQREIWYLIKESADIFSTMQGNNIGLGNMSAHSFFLKNGRFLILNILDLLPNNQQFLNINFHNYYSPQFLFWLNTNQKLLMKNIDIFKSQVFSFALLILQVATCPISKPKFHKHSLNQILWKQIWKKLDEVRFKYSKKLWQFLQMMLREDTRTRPDWNYIKIWINHKQKKYIDVAPCIFWSI